MDGRGKWPRVHKRSLVANSLAMHVGELRELISGETSRTRVTWSQGDGDGDRAVVIVERLTDQKGLPTLHLILHVRTPDRLLRMRQVVKLSRTAQRLGGSRFWFACPACGRRCGALYLPPGRGAFACRCCYRLAYDSESGRSSSRLRPHCPAPPVGTPKERSMVQEAVADLFKAIGLGPLSAWRQSAEAGSGERQRQTAGVGAWAKGAAGAVKQ